MIDDIDHAGLDRAIIMGYYWQKHEMCVARNSEALELVRRWPGRLLAFATVQPKAGPATLDGAGPLPGRRHVRRQAGPYGQGSQAWRTRTSCAWPRPAPRGACHSTCTSTRRSADFYAGKGATPLAAGLRAGLSSSPELDIILAHWGGGLLFYETMPEVRRTLRRVWYDTAASPLLFPTQAIFRAALACVDPAKYPVRLRLPAAHLPAAQAGADFRPFLGELDRAGPAARRPRPASWAAMRPACWARRRPGRTVRIEQGARCPGSRKAPAHGPTPGPLPRQGGARGAPAAGPTREGGARLRRRRVAHAGRPSPRRTGAGGPGLEPARGTLAAPAAEHICAADAARCALPPRRGRPRGPSSTPTASPGAGRGGAVLGANRARRPRPTASAERHLGACWRSSRGGGGEG